MPPDWIVETLDTILAALVGAVNAPRWRLFPHTTPIGGGGNPGTGLNLYIMILSAATLLIIGTLLIFTKPGQRIELTV